MRIRFVRSNLLIGPIIGALLVACGGGGGGTPASQASTPTPTPTASATVGGAVPSGGGGSGGSGGPGGGSGGGGNTVTLAWSENVDRSGSGATDLVTQDYKAVARLTLTRVDVGSWTIAGQALVSGSFKEDYKSDCSHYTDNASGSGTVDVSGGLEAVDGSYQFHLDILGVTGSNATVRDDSPCGGPNNAETTEWPIARANSGGDGTYTDLHHITGTWTKPRTGGNETLSWDLALPD
jgi:hypothetical protein